MESRVLGDAFHAKTQAQRLGMALPRLRWVDPAERQVLELLERPLSFRELMALAQGAGLGSEELFAALGSLLSRQLILLSQG